LEWLINFVGVQSDVPVRINIVQYYETIPDDNHKDDYCPQKHPKSSDPDKAMKIVHEMSKSVGVTASHGIRDKLSSIAGAVMHYGRMILPVVTTAVAARYGGTGIGSMVGGYWGS
jgi:hypothetical protein